MDHDEEKLGPKLGKLDQLHGPESFIHRDPGKWSGPRYQKSHSNSMVLQANLRSGHELLISDLVTTRLITFKIIRGMYR